jgi:membrane-associated protease RseP (regulator of RpoE activity)
MSFLLGVLIFVVALLFSIMLHEAGHFVTAKKFGMKVTQFFVGFGQTLWSRMRGETEYGVKALPFGGYVKITGMTALEEVDPADEARSFRRQPGWQRAIVLLAGSFMHFVLAFVLLFVLAVGIGMQDTTAIGGVDACVPASLKAMDTGSCAGSTAASPARRAGIRTGDKVIAIDGAPVHDWTQLGDQIRGHPAGRPMSVTVLRHGRVLRLTAIPATIPGRSGSFLGIEASTAFQPASPLQGITFAGSTFGQILTGSAAALGHLPSALPDLFAKNRSHTPAGNLTSVVGVADDTGQVVAQGVGWKTKVWEVLLLIVSLNIFVGAFNLLPLLPLDGGHLAVVIFERLRAWLARMFGRPDPGLVDMQKLVPLSVGVFAVLVGLAVLLIAADIVNPVHPFQ